MQALAIFPTERRLEVIDVATPTVREEHDVLVKVREVGLCGTDREISGFYYGEPPPGRDRLILGHEAVGEVVEAGRAVMALRTGDIVALTVRRPCEVADCIACRAGRQDFCTTGRFRERGIHQADGFLAEYVLEHEHYLVKVPRPLAETAVLIEPISVIAKAIEQLDKFLERYPWEPTKLRGLVLGAGPIGLLAGMLLVAHGVDCHVFSREPVSERGPFVRSFGARYISALDTPVEELPRAVGTFDVVFEAVGVPSVAFSALEALAPNGLYVFSGVPGAPQRVEVDLAKIMKSMVLNNHVLFGTVNASRSAFEASVRSLAELMTLFPSSVRGLITSRLPLRDSARALQEPSRGIKQIVTLTS